jgi:hypothetical protein
MVGYWIPGYLTTFTIPIIASALPAASKGNYPSLRSPATRNGQKNAPRPSILSVTYTTHGRGTSFLNGPGQVLKTSFSSQYSLLGSSLCHTDIGLGGRGTSRHAHCNPAHPASPPTLCVIPSFYLGSTYSPQLHLLPPDQFSRVKQQSTLQISSPSRSRKQSLQQGEVVFFLLRDQVAVKQPQLVFVLLHSQVTAVQPVQLP